MKIFITMVAKKDADEVCRGNAFNIAQWAKKTEAEVLQAFKILAAPDTKRLEPQPFDGRRIEKVEGGWLILNGKKYQDEMTRINRRARKTDLQRQYRAEQNGGESRPVGRPRRNGKPDPQPQPGERSYISAAESGHVLPDPGAMAEARLAEKKAAKVGQVSPSGHHSTEEKPASIPSATDHISRPAVRFSDAFSGGSNGKV